MRLSFLHHIECSTADIGTLKCACPNSVWSSFHSNEHRVLCLPFTHSKTHLHIQKIRLVIETALLTVPQLKVLYSAHSFSDWKKSVLPFTGRTLKQDQDQMAEIDR